MKKLFNCFVLSLFILCMLSACSDNEYEYTGPDNSRKSEAVENCEIIGAGGYGAMYDISIDPFDDNIFATRCDMGGLYMSYDKGKNWTRHNILGVPTDIDFDIENEGVIWVSGSGLYKSEDHGRNFELVFPSKDTIITQGMGYENTSEGYYTTNEDYDPMSGLSSVAINRKSDGKNIFVSMGIIYWDGRSNITRIFESENGKDFKKFIDLPATNYFKLEYDETNDCIITITEKGITEIDQDGKEKWFKPYKLMTEANNTIDFDSHYDINTNTNTFAFSAVEENRPHATTSLYFTHNLRDEDSYIDLVTLLNEKKLGEIKNNCWEKELDIASYEYLNYGKKYSFDWETEYVHVANSDCVYFYSEIGTEHEWITCFLQYKNGEFKWIYGSPHKYADYLDNTTWQDYGSLGRCFGMATSSQNPDYFAFSTIGTVYFTPDGETISQCHCTVGNDVALIANDGKGHEAKITTDSDFIPLQETTTNGLNQQTTYETLVDPFDSNHLLMACTDFGLLQSFNNGKTWVHSLITWNGDKTENMSSYFRNTCYDIEFDKDRKGVVYALWSGRHDVPYSPNYNDLTATGAFAISYDGGTSWTMRSIRENNHVIPFRMDVDYNGENRDIYIATYGYGFYVTHDLGLTFEEMNDGIRKTDYFNDNRPAIFANEILSCEDGIYAIVASAAFKLRPDPKNPNNTIYDRGFYKWNESLHKFEEIDLPADVACVRDLEYSEKDHCLYFGAIGRTHWQTYKKYGGGVYRYKDGVMTQIFDDSKFISGLAIDSQGTLYAVEYRGSVYRFNENETNAELLVEGMFHAMKDISFGVNDKILYVSTFGGGMYRITLKN